MKVYIGILAISTALTMGTFYHHSLLHRWYDVLLALPIWLCWFLAATAFYFLLLFLVSLTVDPSKTVRKKAPFFRWLLNQTVWLILHLGRVEVQCAGLEKLEGLPPFLMVANHRSNFDPFIAIAAYPQVGLTLQNRRFSAFPSSDALSISASFCRSTGQITGRRWEPSNTRPSCCKRALCPLAFIRRVHAARRESFCPSATLHFKSQNALVRQSSL